MACDPQTNSDPIECKCIIRLFQTADGPGVVRLVQSVYGNTYYPPALYDPNQIDQWVETGKFVSCVSADGEAIVGHFALELLASGAVAEASDAIVAMEYRHHHLMEDMRGHLREVAIQRGLAGLVGYPVTNHLYSQMAEEHFGAHPCGVALGLWPETFHNMPEPLPQRMSFVIYFKSLRTWTDSIHAETPHAEMLARIAAQWGVSIRRPAHQPPPAHGSIEIEEELEVQTGLIRVLTVGDDSLAAIRTAKARLLAAGARTLLLELPLAQSATSELCRAAEADGFFCCALGPAFAADGDGLLLQFLTEPLNPALVQVHSPFARELLEYVAGRPQTHRKLT